MTVEQPDLFSQPAARHTDPHTSHRAAERAAVSVGSCRRAVLTILVQHRSDREHTWDAAPWTCGLPDYDLVQMLAGLFSASGIRTRRKELVDAGLVSKVGEDDGHTIWAATQAGIDAL